MAISLTLLIKINKNYLWNLDLLLYLFLFDLQLHQLDILQLALINLELLTMILMLDVFKKNQQTHISLLNKSKRMFIPLNQLLNLIIIYFGSNDNTRKIEDDFDVRTHSFRETRNNWIIECHSWSVFTIRSETNPDQFLFVASDKSNNHDKDLDVRTQNKDNQNNHWYFVTNPNFSTPYHIYPKTFQPQAILINHSLTILVSMLNRILINMPNSYSIK
ncbi:unnamed protein product [Paramecium octaurelia]|uniref:Uncharacterized protein n=1 Tax=Paramecium octaurelia TaxID=43137 RepID=A0A8S1U6R0_PAROT|nr:unnamed protein product [Paramecium octaurelia]